MKKILLILLPLLIAAQIGLAKDTVMLKNGDILTGKVIKQTADHIYFRAEAFGAVSLKLNDVAKIQRSDDTPVAPKNAPNTQAKQNLPTVEKIETESAAKKSQEKLKQWSGQAGLAIAMREKTSSNQAGVIKNEKYETYRIYGNVKWKGERNDLKWAWTYRYSEDEYRVRDDYLNLTQNYKHSFKNKNLFATAKTVYQRDYNRRIEDEFLQTAELGIKWFGKDSKVQLSTSAGGGYHMYDRLDSTRSSTTSVSQPEFIFDESFRWNLVKTLALTQKYTHLGDLTNYHFLFSAGLENKLVRDLFVRFEYRLDRDTEVYYDDKGYYDKAILTSLLYKF